MKKVLILVVIAAIVGFAISRMHGRGTASPAGLPSGPELAAGGSAPVAPGAAQPAPAPAATQPAAERTVAARTSSPAAARPAEGARRPVLLSQTTTNAPAQPAAPPAVSPAAVPAPAQVPTSQPVQPGAEAIALQIEQARQLLEAGKRVEARAVLSRLYVASRGEMAAKLRAALDRINAQLVFTPSCLEGAIVHEVQAGDVLTTIGKKYGVPWQMIQRINGMQTDRLRIGQRLKIIPGPASVIAWKNEFRLALFMNNVYVKEYPIGVGKENLTPAGTFVIDSMLPRAPWTKPGGGIVLYGQEGYLLGERWMGFRDEPGAVGLGIHGTNDETTIGTKCSQGCLRMRNADVIELYDFMTIGSTVQIVE